MFSTLLKTVRALSGVVLLVLGAAQFSSAHAASIAISSLTVNNAALTVAITGDGTYSFSTPVVPPAQIVMGSYQASIIQFSAGTATANVYSAPTASMLPAPTGYVDGSTLSVDFSSLRASLSVPSLPALDFALWPLINPPVSGTYNSSTGAYSLHWLENFSVALSGGGFVTGTADVTLSGTAALVPVPAAVWLLGSGLLGLVAVARRRVR